MVDLDPSAIADQLRSLNRRGCVMSDSICIKNLEAALSLANAGLRVFPAGPIFKPKTNRWNKPPCMANWRSLATNDPSRIRYWWKAFPRAIPAVRCDGFVVIDADRHQDGPDGVTALAALADRHGEWPNHPRVLTPGNGEHHYFGQPNPPLGNRTGQLPDGIDVRGIGGFAIGPGAVLPDGTGWHKAPDHSTDLPQLPLWLEQMIRADEIQPSDNNGICSQSPISQREQRYAEAAFKGGIADIGNAPYGKRNTTLNNVAYRLGRMVARGWIDRDKVENCLLFAALRLKNEDGFAAVMATIKSGLDAGCRKPHPDLTDRKWGDK
jgi:hypothetical protein